MKNVITHRPMTRRTVFLVFTLSLLPFWGSSTNASKEQVGQWISSQPVRFSENKGQLTDQAGRPVPSVFFEAQAPGMNLYITDKGLSYFFIEAGEEESESERGDHEEKMEIKWGRVDMELAGAHIQKENIVKELPSAAHFNYYYAHCPQGIMNVRQYEKITVKDVYPGIDWVLYNSSEKGFKYDFIVHSGADPSLIRMVYASALPLKMNSDGSLRIKTKQGTLTEQAPYSYVQETKEEVPCAFNAQKIDDHHTEITFPFSHSLIRPFTHSTLVIDPILYWATFLGGNFAEGVMAMDNDAAGDLYVTGYMLQASPIPTQSYGSAYFQGTFAGGNSDCFIFKFSNTGTLLWGTYYGSPGLDQANYLHVSTTGRVFITGYSDDAGFPTQNAGGSSYFQTYGSGAADAFIIEFNTAGVRQWGTFYGGNGFDLGYCIRTNAAGTIFLTGRAFSNNLPVMNPGGGAYFQGTTNGGNEAFLAEFSSARTFVWGTYYGGTWQDYGTSLCIDVAGSIYVAGYTTATNFPVLNPGGGAYFQASIGGGSYDGFIVKFSSSRVRTWSTYYGGNQDDYLNTVDADALGNVFALAHSESTNLTLVNPGGGAYYQATNGGNQDAVMLKFDNTCNLKWGTYYGGSGNEGYQYNLNINDNIEIDNCNNAYFSFATSSNNIFKQNSCIAGYYDATYNSGNYDIFITKFANTGTLLWATYFGGNGLEFREALSLDNAGSLFIGGEWTGSSINNASYPITNPGGSTYYDGTFNAGTDDCFIAKFTASPVTITLTTAATSTCGCTGSATVSATGGCTYIYSWSNGSSTATISGLCPGSYSVTVTDLTCGAGAVKTAAVTVTSTGATVNISTSNNVSCNGGSNGSATVTVAGGTGPYTYSWSPSGKTTATATGLSSGTYTVMVTDNSGCTSSKTVTISQPSQVAAAVGSGSASCGQSNGSISVTASGGTGSFTYLWSNGATTATTTGISAGTYTVTVTDVNGCTKTATVTVTNTNGGTATATATATVSCNGGNNGSATATITGGTSPYTYSWSNGSTQSSINNLQSTIYTVTITDANGCISTQTVNITQPSSINPQTSSISANCNQSNGSASASASGGTGAYTYSWNNGQATATATGLSAGSYTVTVTDANGCSTTAAANVSNSNGPSAGISAQSNVLCNGGSTGSATVTVTGGTGPYTYSWSNGSTQSSINNLQSTTYTVTITDANGCITTQTLSITQPAIITTTATATATSCGQNNGSASITASGGTGAYTYSWSNGTTQSSINNLQSAVYTVTITDANGCTKTATATVGGSTGVTASIFSSGNVSCNGGNNGTASASASGGIGPYTYSWSNGATQSTINNIQSAIYTVTITDASGCTSTQTISIAQPTAITATATATAANCNKSDGSASVNVTGGTGAYTYSWSNATAAATATGLSVGSYTVLITDNNGCSKTVSVAVGSGSGPTATATATATTIQAGQSTTLLGSGGNTYSWSPPKGLSCTNCQNPSASPSTTTTYTLTVTDVNGCTATDKVTVIVDIPCMPSSDVALLPNAFSPNMDGHNDRLCLPNIPCIESFIYKVYDRWGELVFEADNTNVCWDGTFRGKELNTAVFVYFFDARLTNGEVFSQKGNISLMK